MNMLAFMCPSLHTDPNVFSFWAAALPHGGPDHPQVQAIKLCIHYSALIKLNAFFIAKNHVNDTVHSFPQTLSQFSTKTAEF